MYSHKGIIDRDNNDFPHFAIDYIAVVQISGHMLLGAARGKCAGHTYDDTRFAEFREFFAQVDLVGGSP